MSPLGSPEISFLTVIIAVVLFLIGYWKSKLRSSEEILNEILHLFLLAFSAATAIVSAFTVTLATLMPTMLVDPQGSLYYAGVLGAAVLFIWSFTVFWRQVLILKTKQEVKTEATAAPVFVPSASKKHRPPTAKSRMQLFLSGAETYRVMRGHGISDEMIRKIEEWLSSRLPDARNALILTYFSPAPNFEEVTLDGTVQDSTRLPYRFHITLKGDDILKEKSWIK